MYETQAIDLCDIKIKYWYWNY